MIYPVGDTGDSIEIGQYRAMDKGSLKAFFSLVIYSSGPYKKADKMLDCKYFDNGSNKWFTFPQKEIKKDEKTEYIPYRSFGDKDYFNMLRSAVLQALANAKNEGPHETNCADYNRKNLLQTKSPADPRECPF